jgi:hypothetical protein
MCRVRVERIALLVPLAAVALSAGRTCAIEIAAQADVDDGTGQQRQYMGRHWGSRAVVPALRV